MDWTSRDSKRVVLAFVMVVASGSRAATASPLQERAPFEVVARATAWLDEVRREAGFPGASAGFVLPDGTLGEVVVGFADREHRRALHSHDRLLAGSIGKTYVAAVALQLAAEERLGLDDPLARWLGDEPWYDRLPNGDAVTLRQLATHRSGIPEHVLLEEFWAATREDPDRRFAPHELVAFILGREPLFAPGEQFLYADTNFVLLAMAMERAAGKGWFQMLGERVLEPLELDGTVPAVGRRIERLVPGHLDADNPLGWPTTTMPDGELFVIDPQCEFTGGGLATTAPDLARWAHALYGGSFLSPDGLAEMIEAAAETHSRRSPGRYGLGVQIWDSELGPVHGHGGWFPGYRSEMGWFAEHDLAVAVQINSDVASEAGSTRELLVALAKAILEE